MDNIFTPRTHDELLAAVRVFQQRRRQTSERLYRKLEQGVLQEEMA